jgi:hypothetical protein
MGVRLWRRLVLSSVRLSPSSARRSLEGGASIKIRFFFPQVPPHSHGRSPLNPRADDAAARGRAQIKLQQHAIEYRRSSKGGASIKIRSPARRSATNRSDRTGLPSQAATPFLMTTLAHPSSLHQYQRPRPYQPPPPTNRIITMMIRSVVMSINALLAMPA